MLNIVNFAHGALYMVGAFFAWMLLNYAGVNYWMALVIAPIDWASGQSYSHHHGLHVCGLCVGFSPWHRGGN